MTQADHVLSTPPTNTSAPHSCRRRFLAQAAAAAAAGGALGMTLPLPPGAEWPDPIFAAIEAHDRARGP